MRRDSKVFLVTTALEALSVLMVIYSNSTMVHEEKNTRSKYGNANFRESNVN